jgi:hypothetical protein
MRRLIPQTLANGADDEHVPGLAPGILFFKAHGFGAIVL